MFARSSIAIQYHRSLWLFLILCGKVDINGKKLFLHLHSHPHFFGGKKEEKAELNY
jgi:hypothetical protein